MLGWEREASMTDDKAKIRQERHELFDRIYAFYDVKILNAALETGIFEHVATAPKTVDELASATGMPPRVVRMLTVSLSAMKLLRHEEHGFRATEKAIRFFGKDSPNSMAHAVRLADWQFDALVKMPELVAKGSIIWDGFNHYLKNIEEDSDVERYMQRQKVFNEALAGSATATGKVVLANADLAGATSLLDIGGSLGVFASVVLDKYPSMRAAVFDLPQVAPLARAEFERRGLASRAGAVGGDFVADPWPEGHDLISFVRIFAARPREEILVLLRKAYAALPQGGRALFYEEHVLPSDPNDVPPGAAWASVFLAMGSFGEIRRVDEWLDMFAEAGFRDMKFALGNPWGLVVGTK